MLPAVVKAWEITPPITLTLLKIPARAEIGHVKEVDPGHQNDLGEADGCRLDGHRNTQSQQAEKRILPDAEAGQTEVKPEGFPVPVQIGDRRQKAHALPDHRCECRTENGKPQISDKQNVQHGIQHGGNGDEYKGALAVTHPAQDRADDVVPIDEDQPADTGDHIIHGIFFRSRRSVEPLQHGEPQAVTNCSDDQ